jgi:ubiquinone/menaquinone biosynthesis C-methylase UbiE
MKGNYDHIAWFYDTLARLVYGKAILRAQQYLIGHIPAGANILIAGGGTGWILEEIARLYSSGLTITYVDLSSKMIAQARRRNAGNNKVTFITAPAEKAPPGKYDVVMTPFLFDNFSDSTLQSTFSAIDRLLVKDGVWLYCDFQDAGKWWQKALLKIMYAFFRVSCGIETAHLPDAKGCFSEHHYKIKEKKTFFNEFIIARVYQRA